MKTCSKCKRQLPLDCFVKSARYSDNLYPSCKECRKATRLLGLENKTLCIKCNKEPHMKGNPYCRTCIRIINDLPIERERPNVDRDNKTMCCACRVNPRRTGGHYCVECANAMNRIWWKENGNEYLSRDDNREKHNARAFVNWLVDSGKLEKLPCQVCGAVKSEAHHHKGYSMEFRADVIWLCKKHHLEADRQMKVDKASPAS